ncbi:SchA/CurD-like domain-containing protein [Sphaerisporangium sp. TRM90804]|uniref:SchA/CurD-like domain-containing protein n=1 Tax=Sphaerisporangium sp. TRM90804 TaxID=3031113 RepID=UPI002447D9DB|nr:SchA/CurD-like domain-containing protein [Sphaerisporangium sp. TRM90804]MDH2427186.1 SchA/CurD-like domain-containing protein [Sphaerisporangium sp. TRM90804]
MAYAAITYRVRPGHEKEINEIFSGFTRPESPVLTDEDGKPSGLLLGTGLFLKDDVVVRVIHYEGSLEDVARHMSVQEGVREAERRLLPYLAAPRDTSTPQGFLEHFGTASMETVQQFSLPPHVADELRRATAL